MRLMLIRLHITLAEANIPDDATTNYRAEIIDKAGNFNKSASFTISSDNTKPQVASILRPSSETVDTNAASVKFEVTTSEVVRIADITATDFVVTPTGANLAVAPIGGNGTLANKFEVTVSGYDAGTFEGNISLALAGWFRNVC